jgi:hypothetical protein
MSLWWRDPITYAYLFLLVIVVWWLWEVVRSLIHSLM